MTERIGASTSELQRHSAVTEARAPTPDGSCIAAPAPQQPSITPDYRTASPARSLWQMANSFIPLLAAWTAMYFSLGLSYALVLALAVPAGAMVVRIFSIQRGGTGQVDIRGFDIRGRDGIYS